MKHMENSTRRHILVSNVRAYGRFLFGGMIFETHGNILLGDICKCPMFEFMAD